MQKQYAVEQKESKLSNEEIAENIANFVGNQFDSKEKKSVKYRVQFKIKNGRETRLINYIVEETSKTNAEKLGEEKLIENGFTMEQVLQKRVTKANSSDKEDDVLLYLDEIPYEVSFNIKIGSERYRKTLIINATDEKCIPNKLSSICKQRYKGYKTINKLEIKEATDESKESSVLLEETNTPVQNIEQDDEKNFDAFVQDCLGHISSILDEEVEKLEDNVKNKGVYELRPSVKNKKAEEMLKSFFDDGSRILVPAESLAEAETKNKKILTNYLGINREDRRKFKFALERSTVGEILKRDLLDLLTKYLLNTKEEWKKDKSTKKIEDSNKEIIEEIKTILREQFQKAKTKLLDCLDETDKMVSGEKKRDMKQRETEVVCSLDAENIDIIRDEKNKSKISGLRRKGSILFAKLTEFICAINYANGRTGEVKITATDRNDAGRIVTTALAAGFFGDVHIRDIDKISLSWMENGKPQMSVIDLTSAVEISANNLKD